MRWTVYGKINQISKSSGAVIGYGYDPGGNRTYKLYQSNDTLTSTYYVRDAQGNVLAVYEKMNAEELKWSEQHLYGSSRLGMWKADTTISLAPPVVLEDNPVYDSLQFGSRLYELSNHLGNVLSVISDKKIGNDSSGVVNYYLAEVLSQNDYYPFGMGMVGRKFSTSAYRYGFNGKENDNEVKGEGNQQDYGMRIYDPRLGRFLSVDPIAAKYPMLTPYQFASNRPIDGIDLDGLEWYKDVAKVALFVTNPAAPLLMTKSGQEIAQGAVERADKTIVQPIKEMINRQSSGNNTTFGKTTIADPNIATQNLQQEFETNKAIGEGFVETVKDYGDLIQDAFSGDKKAIGALGFEAVLLALPFDEIRFAKGSMLKAAVTVAQPGGRRFAFTIADDAIKFADKSLGEGFYDFVVMESGELRIGDGHYYLSNKSEQVYSAGEIWITKDGKIQTVTNNSGHYQPKADNSVRAAQAFIKNKVAAKDIDVVDVTK